MSAASDLHFETEDIKKAKSFLLAPENPQGWYVCAMFFKDVDILFLYLLDQKVGMWL
jgi:hypothetical protein